jgi:hypothetical protein
MLYFKACKKATRIFVKIIHFLSYLSFDSNSKYLFKISIIRKKYSFYFDSFTMYSIFNFINQTAASNEVNRWIVQCWNSFIPCWIRDWTSTCNLYVEVTIIRKQCFPSTDLFIQSSLMRCLIWMLYFEMKSINE